MDLILAHEDTEHSLCRSFLVETRTYWPSRLYNGLSTDIQHERSSHHDTSKSTGYLHRAAKPVLSKPAKLRQPIWRLKKTPSLPFIAFIYKVLQTCRFAISNICSPKTIHHNYNTPMLILLPPGASTQGSKAPFKMANSIPLNRCGTTIFGATAAAPWGKRNGAEIKLNERKRWGKQAKDEEKEKKRYLFPFIFAYTVCKMKIRVVITHIHNYPNLSLKKRQIMRRKKG